MPKTIVIATKKYPPTISEFVVLTCDTSMFSVLVASSLRQMTTGISATELNEIKQKAKKYGVIGIDEGQFFPDIVEFCEEMANAGKTVIVAALDGTFQRKVCLSTI